MLEHILVDYLPKAGLIYRSQLTVLSNGRREAILLKVFASTGIIASGRPSKDDVARGRKKVEDVLIEVFIKAAAEEYKPLIEDGAVLDFESTLKDNTWWAAGRIGKSLFAELFHALVDARLGWQQAPRPPFDPEDHSALARQIDQFLAGQKRWGRVGARIAFYELAGGFKKEEEEEEEDDDNEDDEDEYESSSEEGDEEEIGPIKNVVDGAGVAAALACGEAVYAAAADFNDESQALDTLPQSDAMDIDEKEEEVEEEEDQHDMMMH